MSKTSSEHDELQVQGDGQALQEFQSPGLDFILVGK